MTNIFIFLFHGNPAFKYATCAPSPASNISTSFSRTRQIQVKERSGVGAAAEVPR